MRFYIAFCALLSLTKTSAQDATQLPPGGRLLDTAGNPFTENILNIVDGPTADACGSNCVSFSPSPTLVVGYSFNPAGGCTCYTRASTTSPDTAGRLETGTSAFYGDTFCFSCISTQPSSQPSGQPSSMPSEMPSSQPSSVPSEMPSSIPSEMPSSQPSSIPSEMPSSIPSSMPSSMPSSIPSEMPSTQPSSIPSMIPSSQPSGQPTSQPSESPSAQPSCTPSMAPTNPLTMFLFYPDWSGTGEGCRNDGGEPAYMTANPRDYLSSSIVDCCSTYFGWIFDRCTGNLPGICSRALFYPDWEGANQGCIDDGNEPDYMRDNAMGLLYVQLVECCTQHYSWNFLVCTDAPANLNSNLYYPDWEGDDTCKNGGGQPDYMNNAPTLWMHDSLAACCKANYRHIYAECVGSDTTSGSSTLSTLPGLWYPDWSQNSDNVCKNDNNEAEYMTNNPGMWMFSSQVECCREHYFWNYVPCAGAGATEVDGSTSTTTATFLYYMNYARGTCVQDCLGPTPATCGGLAESWDITYLTLRICCAERNSWNRDCRSLS